MKTFAMFASEVRLGDELEVVEDSLYGAYHASYLVSSVKVDRDAMLRIELREGSTLKRILVLCPDAKVHATTLNLEVA